MNLGNTFISKLDNVLLNPSASAPPPNWLDADCLAICLAISPVTLWHFCPSVHQGYSHQPEWL